MKNQAIEGYAEIKPPARQVTKIGEARTFDVVDYSNESERTIISVDEGKKERPQRKYTKKQSPPPTPEITEAESKEQFEKKEGPQISVVFKTDVLETEIYVDHVYKDQSVVCIFYSSNSPTKVRPKRGTNFTICIDGDDIDVYSPGVYVPAPHIDSEVAFFLVDQEETE